jgi:hypothetical protein
MPVELPQRCNPDSIAEFRRAAKQRYFDGLELATNNRRTAAIYLWGYTAEMLLKAAYFELIGFAEMKPIQLADLQTAKFDVEKKIWI